MITKNVIIMIEKSVSLRAPLREFFADSIENTCRYMATL